MVSGLVASLSALAVTYIFLRLLQAYTHDANEPPILAGEIPFISPLLGMAKQSKFYTEMRDKFNLPIYTLRLPGTRMYIVNDLKLIAAAQHQVRTLDFTPIETRAAVNVMGTSPQGKDILHMNRNGVGEHSYAIEFGKAIHHAVSPGKHLDSLNRAAVRCVSTFLDKWAAKAPQNVRLFDWAQREIALATTEAVYGPKNPFKDPAVLGAFWRFEPGVVILLLQFLPTLLAKESLKAREVLYQAFLKYFANAGHESGSALVQARYQHSADYGISLEDTARFEMGGVFAILTNTTPTAFWVLWHLISDPIALAKCRAELEQVCHMDDVHINMDITNVKKSCPLLVSTLQEVLRFHGTGTSVRIVQKDHLLNGQYLLKKGNTLMIPGRVVHTSKAIYGDDVHKFVHDRFVKTPDGRRLNPAGFRGFGGGATLCPGRHFVSTEIIAFVALAILRFDYEPAAGQWMMPTTNKASMPATVPAPDADVEVNIVARKGHFGERKWNVTLEDSNKALALVIEDLADD